MNAPLDEHQTIESANVQLKSYVDRVLDERRGNFHIGNFFKENIQETRQKVLSDIEGLSKETYIDKLLSQTTDIINDAETLSDLYMGVIRTRSAEPEIAFVGNKVSDKSHVTIRDARFQDGFNEAKSKADEFPEACIVIAAGQLRGVLQIIKDSESGDKEKASKEAVGLFKAYKDKILASSSFAEREKIVKDMNTEMANVLRENNLVIDSMAVRDYDHKKLAKGMGLVRDLTNLLDDKHGSIVTITDIGGANHISGTIPVSPLSYDLGEYYEPSKMAHWAEDLNPFLRHSLKGDFVERIKDGRHVISSQLPVPGLRNAALEQTYVKAHDGRILEDKRMLRSGTPAHNNGEGSKKKKAQRDLITSCNLEHMINLSGLKVVDLTVLNSDTAMFGEKEIVSGVRGGIELYKTKMAVSVEGSKLQGSKPGSDYSQKGVSVSHNKTKHVRDVVESFEKRDGDSIQAICCKSGKDRTQAMISQNVLSTIEKLQESGLEVNVDQAQKAIVRAGHGNAVASGVGATKGIMGTKIGNVYAALKGDSVLLQFKDELKTEIANLNHVKIAKDYHVKSPLISSVREHLAQSQLEGSIVVSGASPEVMSEARKIKEQIEESREISPIPPPRKKKLVREKLAKQAITGGK